MQHWWESIDETKVKIKEVEVALRDAGYLLPVVFILTTVTAFGIGRLSVLEDMRPPVRISGVGESTQNMAQQSNTKASIPAGGKVVASKKGTKYHYSWCTGAQAMSEENKVWFDSVEMARKAGYLPAGNCPGLR